MFPAFSRRFPWTSKSDPGTIVPLFVIRKGAALSCETYATSPSLLAISIAVGANIIVSIIKHFIYYAPCLVSLAHLLIILTLSPLHAIVHMPVCSQDSGSVYSRFEWDGAA